ncbi:pilus assembly protein CpaD [Pseudomonas sp. ODNR1LW]|nr:pilus assembly protein CpaD [Pseudomonas sp. ODNR1LW]
MIRLTALAAVSTLLSACVSGPSGAPPVNVASRFVLQVEPGVDRIALAVRDGGLSANQQAALSDLASRFEQAQAPLIRVEAPSGDDPVAHQIAWNTRDALIASGVPAGRVQVVSYAAPAPRAPILAGFETVQAVVPNCAATVSAMRSNISNQSSSGFGCSVTANLAAQIANPRDIQTPRTMTPGDAGRRSVVIDKYRAGAQTAAVIETLLQTARVSSAVD